MSEELIIRQCARSWRESKKYIAENVLAQWLGMCASVVWVCHLAYFLLFVNTIRAA